MSCRRHGMLIQGPAPGPKSKLIISSLLTLTHFLDCCIATRNAVSIVLLLQIMGGGIGVGGRGTWGMVHLYYVLGGETGVTNLEKLLYQLFKTILKVTYLIIILWISLEKLEFWFQSLFRVFYPTLHSREGRVYHFSLLICDPCSSFIQPF